MITNCFEHFLHFIYIIE